MRTVILASPDSWYYRDLRRAAPYRDQLSVASFADLQAHLGEADSASVSAGGTELSRCDVVIVRSMPPGSLEQVIFRMDALARIEQAGCLVVNPPRALEVAIDDYLQHLTVERGLSRNTLAAYGADLTRFCAFAADRGVSAVDEVDAPLVLAHASKQAREGQVALIQRRESFNDLVARDCALPKW